MNSIKKETDIEIFTRLQRLITLFQRVNQLSWNSDQARKRYPSPEAMTNDEMLQLIKMYLALGFDIEAIYEDWTKEYKEYKDENKQ